MKFSNIILILLSIFIKIETTDKSPCMTIFKNIKEDGKEDRTEYSCDYEAGESPSSNTKICKFDASNNCFEQDKECSDVTDTDEVDCADFIPNGSSFKCILSGDSCRSITCAEINDINKCSLLKPTNSKKKCTVNQSNNGCEEVDNDDNSNGSPILNYSILIIYILLFF